jgi:hypothetical protein
MAMVETPMKSFIDKRNATGLLLVEIGDIMLVSIRRVLPHYVAGLSLGRRTLHGTYKSKYCSAVKNLCWEAVA